MTEISPAILTNDISDFRKKYAELFALSHFFQKLHVDFADGVFVSNQTVMPADLAFLKASPFTLVAHFMTYHPEKYFRSAKTCGFQYALIHAEAFEDKKQLEHALLFGEHLGLKMGLVFNPFTDFRKFSSLYSKIQMIQLMGIQPGAQGREFMPATYERLKELKNLTKNVIISVDGGIKIGIASKLAANGANILVAGSAILRAEDKEAAIESLQADIKI
ncbi:MAG TPA: hypothetical protein VL306_02865 [Methylomirabilota bacterium]|nr:hypothetical protein [Methylomirabilota bacterium]